MANVIRTKVVGWWVDGCYQSIGYDENKLAILAKGLKSGNPDQDYCPK